MLLETFTIKLWHVPTLVIKRINQVSQDHVPMEQVITHTRLSVEMGFANNINTQCQEEIKNIVSYQLYCILFIHIFIQLIN